MDCVRFAELDWTFVGPVGFAEISGVFYCGL